MPPTGRMLDCPLAAELADYRFSTGQVSVRDALDELNAADDYLAEIVNGLGFSLDDDVIRPGHVLGAHHPGDLGHLFGDRGGLTNFCLDQHVGPNSHL